MTREAYPLAWPTGWKRTPATKRASSRFDGGNFVRTRDAILKSLRLMKTANGVITSDLPVKSNGMPYATGRADDPGIAVWWVRAGKEQVIACDLYKTHGENLRAVQLTLDAIRGIERWGASDLVERAFEGFKALGAGAAPEQTTREWWEILEVDPALIATLDEEDLLVLTKARHRKLAQLAHPDRGGSTEKMVELNNALETAEEFIAKKAASNGAR